MSVSWAGCSERCSSSRRARRSSSWRSRSASSPSGAAGAPRRAARPRPRSWPRSCRSCRWSRPSRSSAPSPSTSSSSTSPSSTTASAAPAPTRATPRRSAAARLAGGRVRIARERGRPGGAGARRRSRALARHPHPHRAPHPGRAPHPAGEALPHRPRARGARPLRAHAARGSATTLRVAMREEITALWQTDELRRERPTVGDEVKNVLWYVEEVLCRAARASCPSSSPGPSSAPTASRWAPAHARCACTRGWAGTWTATRSSRPRCSRTRCAPTAPAACACCCATWSALGGVALPVRAPRGGAAGAARLAGAGRAAAARGGGAAGAAHRGRAVAAQAALHRGAARSAALRQVEVGAAQAAPRRTADGPMPRAPASPLPGPQALLRGPGAHRATRWSEAKAARAGLRQARRRARARAGAGLPPGWSWRRACRRRTPQRRVPRWTGGPAPAEGGARLLGGAATRLREAPGGGGRGGLPHADPLHGRARAEDVLAALRCARARGAVGRGARLRHAWTWCRCSSSWAR